MQRENRPDSRQMETGRWIRLLLFILILAVVYWVRTKEGGLTDLMGQSELGTLEVHYLDVGQADCTILISQGEALLIDAGNNGDSKLVTEYLDQLEIERLVYAVGTHSHEDHVGGLDQVILRCDPESVILPEEEIKTKTYRDVWDAIEEKDIPAIRPEVGEVYQFGEASFEILGPSEGEKPSPNDYSVCLMVTFGENRFLFTGDAEEADEAEMLKLGISLECDVFQAGHHGSSTSNSRKFLQAADPVYVVISCEEGNSYGHPHAEVLAEMEDQDIMVYRTDLQGTLIATSDGKNIHWTAERSAERPNGKSVEK